MTFTSRLLVGSALCLLAAPAFAQTAQSAQAGPQQRPTAQARPAQRPAAPAADQVVITGQPSQVRTSIDRLSYSVANDLQTTSGSVADALRNVPGVEVDAQGNVSLRGDQNVTILIDGRPSGAFRGEGRADALQQFPANQLERVEVITNPNAAQSPEGTGGVINLITKQTRKPGTTGSVRASVGTEGRYALGVSVTRSMDKLTLSGDAGYRANAGTSEGFTNRQRLDTASGKFVESRNRADSNSGGGFRNARLSADYDLDKTTRLSAELTHRAFEYDGDGVSTYQTDSPSGGLALDYKRPFEISFGNAGTDLRTSYRKRLGQTATSGSAAGTDHEFVTDLILSQNKFNNDQSARYVYTVPALAASAELFTRDVDTKEVRLKSEFAKPFGETKTRIGYEGQRQSSDYDNFGARGPTPASLVTDAAYTNKFEYEQTVNAVFGTVEKPFGKFTVQGGLRLEQVNIDINQRTSKVRASDDYFRAYPTVYLAYDFADSSRVRASYSRRIQRPQPLDLNPYRVYVDPQNVREGNPNLKPEITDSFEASWQKRAAGGFYLATLFYRQSSDGITDVIKDLGGNVFLTTRENLSQSRRAGLELIANGRLAKTLTYNVSGTVQYNEIDVRSTVFSGKRDNTSIGGRGSLNWQPTPNDFFQVSGFMMGEQLQAQGVRKPSGLLNLGYRRKVNDKLSIVLTANNVLDTMKERIETDTTRFREVSERVFMPPSLFVGVTYSFGGQGSDNRRRPQDPGFDYETGGGGGGGGAGAR